MDQRLARKEFDFAAYDEADWTPLRDERFPSAGSWVQKPGFIVPQSPDGATEEQLFGGVEGAGGCYAMRFLKGVALLDGRAEMEVALTDRAAPYLCFRAQAPQHAAVGIAAGQAGKAGTHGSLYALVVFNQCWKGRGEQGVNLWKYLAPGTDRPAAWRQLAWWNVPIRREQRLRLAVEFRREKMRVFLDGKELGNMSDYDSLGPGAIGFAAIEGLARFYNFAVGGASE